MQYSKRAVLIDLIKALDNGEIDIDLMISSNGFQRPPTIMLITNTKNGYNYPDRINQLCAKTLAQRDKELEEEYRRLNDEESKIKRKAPARHVYLMVDNQTKKYKIGKSKTPEFRERTLQSEKPDIELLFSCHESIISEKRLHEMYAHKRIRGEWFDLDKKDISNIRKLMQA